MAQGRQVLRQLRRKLRQVVRSYERRIARHAPYERFRGLESLEQRVFLSSPGFEIPLLNQIMTTGAALTLGVDGFDADGDHLTLTAETNNAGLVAIVPTGNRFAKLNFVENDGTTIIGSIIIELFDDRSPTATNRFVTLATNAVGSDGTLDPDGTPFYTDVLVHRVVPNFVIQTGDAVNGNGTGGSPLGTFNDAFDPILSFAGSGALAMANSGANTNNSQWFITAAPTPHLDQKHMIFGQMVSGFSVYNNLINRPRDASDRPLSPPKLDSVEIIEADAPKQEGTVILVPQAGFEGGTVNVTVTLTDDDGNSIRQTIQTQVFGIKDRVVTLAPGGTVTFFPQFNHDGGSSLDLNVATALSGATVSANDAAKSVTVTAPANFTGMFDVTVVASKLSSVLQPAVQTYTVVVQSPGDPTVLTRVKAPATGSELGGVTVGNLLYTAAGSAGIEIFDLTNPAAPTKLGGFNTAGQARAIAVDGDYAYVADGTNGLVILNISNPASITQVGRAAALQDAMDVVVIGNTVVVADFEAGVSTFDVTDRANPVRLQTLKQLATNVTVGKAVALVRSGNTVFVSDQVGKLVAIDVADPDAMEVISYLTITGVLGTKPGGMDLVGTTLYLVDENQGLLIYDVSNPTQMKLIGQHFMLLAGVKDVAVIHETAVVSHGTNRGYTFVDVSNLASPREDYRFSTPATGGTPIVYGKNLLLPAGISGYTVMDAHAFVNREAFRNTLEFVDNNGVPVSIYIHRGRVRVVTADNGQIETIEVLESDGRVYFNPLTPDLMPGDYKTILYINTPPGQTTTIGNIIVSQSVDAVIAPNVNITGSIVTRSSSLGVMIFNDITGARLNIGARATINDRPFPEMVLIADQVRNTSITSQAGFSRLHVTRWIDDDGTADTISAPWIGSLQTSDGDFGADLTLAGSTRRSGLGSAIINGILSGAQWRITGEVGLIEADATTSTFKANITSRLTRLLVHGNASGAIAARIIGEVDVEGDLNSALLLAGANLGADIAVGGTGANGDAFNPGQIGRLRVGGNMLNSRVLAGLNPVNGIIGDGNDTILGGNSSVIGSIFVGGQVTGSSLFAAGLYPPVVRINNQDVETDGNPLFF